MSWPAHGLLLVTGLMALREPAAENPAALHQLAGLQTAFLKIRGQSRGHFEFAARTRFGIVLVARDGKLTYSPGGEAEPVLTEDFVSGNPRPVPGRRAPTRVSRFIGNDASAWAIDRPTYQEVRLGEVWPGISVALRARVRSVEKIFTIQPGARVDRIRLRVRGARSLRVDQEGSLVASSDGGRVRFTAPIAYQERGGLRHSIQVSFVLAGSIYGFRLGAYDPTSSVVIDPILESSYIGGADGDSINALVVDPSNGDILVAGRTYSMDFPGALAGAQPRAGGGVAGFVARFDPQLQTLRSATFLGGSEGDEILGLAIHPQNGDVYVAGTTTSADFPATLSGARPRAGGGIDGFLARLDPTLTQLRGATYFGGGDNDSIIGMAVHPGSGDVYIAGSTVSADLPGSPGGAQAEYASGGGDGFVARFDATLTRLLQSTYLGGENWDYLHALAIHPSNGEILVGGQTLGTDLPATDGGANLGYPGNGNWDAFVARLDPTLTRFLQTTYLGGNGLDDVRSIAVRPNGEILVAGVTTYVDFPATQGGAQPSAPGELDGFVARFNATLTALLQATYLGGAGDDYGWRIAVHPTRGDVYVTGETFSTDFPGTAGGAQTESRGGDEGFVARLDPTLTHLVQTTYLGGAGDDSLAALAISPASGEVVVGGATTSTDVPSTTGSAQPAYGGGSGFFGGDGFVTRLPASLSEAGGQCTVDANTICLNENRFRVRVAWHVPSQNRSGPGMAVPLTGDTGYFWFFDERNVELVVKVLDARTVNGYFWVFYGALSSVEYTLTVTDMDSGLTRTYPNTAGTLASVADTSAFADSAGGAAPASSPEGPEIRSAAELYAMYAAATQSLDRTPVPVAPCAAGGTTVCLNHERFAVAVDWEVPSQGRSGHGTAVPLTADTGYFWFFTDANVELVVKALDGRGVNGHYWVFYGALSNVQYTITVTDTQTGTVKTYRNASGTLASVADTSAF